MFLCFHSKMSNLSLWWRYFTKINPNLCSHKTCHSCLLDYNDGIAKACLLWEKVHEIVCIFMKIVCSRLPRHTCCQLYLSGSLSCVNKSLLQLCFCGKVETLKLHAGLGIGASLVMSPET